LGMKTFNLQYLIVRTAIEWLESSYGMSIHKQNACFAKRRKTFINHL